MQQTDEIKRLIAGVMEEWGNEFLARRRAALEQRIAASGKLDSRLSKEITLQARQDAVTMLIAFPEHGRFIDMRRLHRPAGGEDLVTAIEEWIREKGLEARMVRRFMKTYGLRTVPSDVLNRIAWGIVRSPRKRRRPWYNRPRSAAVTDLFNLVAERLPDEVIRQQKFLMKN